jgi:hypothetical protein
MQQAKAKFELAKKEMGRRDFESMCMPVLTWMLTNLILKQRFKL